VNICLVEQLILGNKQITVYDIASNISISVEKIIHEHLMFNRVAWWVAEMLTFDQKTLHVAVFVDHLHWFELVGNTFLE
jgi:hypothetical protein